MYTHNAQNTLPTHTRNHLDTGGATKASAEYHLPDYTEPEPTRWPRTPKEEGEAERNNVVMSAGKRSCPDMICYLLSGIFYLCSFRSIVLTAESATARTPPSP